MTSVALSPKFQIVIPKDVRQALKLVAGQRMTARVNEGRVEFTPELPMSAARGMFPGIDSTVLNDPEGPEWPGGCDPLPAPMWTSVRGVT
jgi:AbrB family looped-hinge helix DNA binding protein